jgi:hypothetical protein
MMISGAGASTVRTADVVLVASDGKGWIETVVEGAVWKGEGLCLGVAAEGFD